MAMDKCKSDVFLPSWSAVRAMFVPWFTSDVPDVEEQVLPWLCGSATVGPNLPKGRLEEIWLFKHSKKLHSNRNSFSQRRIPQSPVIQRKTTLHDHKPHRRHRCSFTITNPRLHDQTSDLISINVLSVLSLRPVFPDFEDCSSHGKCKDGCDPWRKSLLWAQWSLGKLSNCSWQENRTQPPFDGELAYTSGLKLSTPLICRWEKNSAGRFQLSRCLNTLRWYSWRTLWNLEASAERKEIIL